MNGLLKKDDKKYWTEQYRTIECADGKVIKRNRIHPILDFIICISCFLLSVFSIGVAIDLIVDGIVFRYSFVYILLSSVMIGGTAVFVMALGRAFFLERHSKYSFCEDGIWIKDPVRKPKLVLWKEFQQICICYASYTTKGERAAHVVICCVKRGEKKDFYGRWKADSVFHFRKVITLGYTDELYNIIKIKCPYEIVDLRQTPQYKLKRY